jgi:YHS domain-containing protein
MKRILWALPLLLAACDAGTGAKAPAPSPSTMPPAATSGDRAKDVVCQMMVDKEKSIRHVHDGTAYYFCAEECLKQFKADPKKHAAPCACGKTSAKCPCDHCGHHLGRCDCGK